MKIYRDNLPDNYGLQWKRVGGGFVATPDDDFWYEWRRRKTRIKESGIVLRKVEGQWELYISDDVLAQAEALGYDFFG